jgi:hypothetical protein
MIVSVGTGVGVSVGGWLIGAVWQAESRMITRKPISQILFIIIHHLTIEPAFQIEWIISC